MVEIVRFDFVRHILQISDRLRESYLYREVDKMYIELIGERVLCVCFALRVHCTFDGDEVSKLQSRSCLSCVFSIIVSNMHFFSNVFHMF